MLEWLEISPELTLVATTTRAYLHVPPAFGANPFQLPMRGQGTPETTHWLFEGAIAAAQRTSPQPTPSERADRSAQPLSVGHWAYRLAGYFHSTHATERLLPLVAERFAKAGRHPLARWAEQKITEEAGHAELALRDLSELGYRARRLVEALVPPRAGAWVRLFEQLAAAEDPVGCVGYAHALERLALLRGPAEVSAIEQYLPAGVNATRCLRVHSALGSDANHVRTNVTATCTASADERRAIVRACYLTACIYFDPALDDDFHSAGLAEKVASFRAPARSSGTRAPDNATPNR
ncbi:MAG TPA: hypothetical protein VFK05_11790 [Polyangiaceae bacterium]|nr:hypothetical protein [Polyangiaceae bacterium]